MKLSELRAARAKKVDALSALVAKMNADDYAEDKADQSAYDALKAEIAGFDTKIERQQEADRLAGTLARPLDYGTPEERRMQLPPGVFRSSKLKNFTGADAEIRAFRFGMFGLASVMGSEKAAKWCRENGIELKAHSEGVNSAGGFFVPEEFATAIIDLRDSYGYFRRLCQVMPMGRDTMTVPRRVGGLTAYPVGEGQAGTQSQAQWNQVRLTAKKWMVLTLMSSELDEDAVVSIGDMLVGEIAYAFAVAEDTAGFSGDGTSTYHGTVGFRALFNTGVGTAAALAGAVDAATGHDTFAEIDSSDLAKLQGTLPQYVYERGNPAWICSQACWANVFERLIGASGGVTKDQASGRTVRMYNGYPAIIVPSMPTSTGDLSDLTMLMFGDIAMAATFGDRRGMTIARSTEYKFAEDQIAIKGTERFDINVHDVGTSAAAGPVVALIGE